MESYYEINVSLNGKHFFATAPRSIKAERDLNEIYPVMKEKFPETEGYMLTVTKWESYGKHIDMK